MFFCLDGLMQAFRVAPALQDAAGELVDDKHLAVLDHVLDVFAVERLGAQRLDEVVDQTAVLGRVEVLDVERLLGLGHAGLGDRHGALLLVDLVVFAHFETRDDARELTVRVGRRLRGAADDERGARFVDEDAVHFVDDAEGMAALHAMIAAHGHVVAQVVEAELGVCAVGDVGGVHLLAGGRIHRRLDDADFHAHGTVDGTHPLGVTFGQIVVDGDQVGAVARQRPQIHRHGGDQRLALAGLHLGNVPLEEDDAAHELHVEGPQAESAFGALTDGGERLEHQILQGLATLQAAAELCRLADDLLVGETLVVWLELVDMRDLLCQHLHAPAFARAQDLLYDVRHALRLVVVAVPPTFSGAARSGRSGRRAGGTRHSSRCCRRS